MSLKEEYEVLRRVPFFAEIEPSKLKLLAFMSERVAFDPGMPLFRQGDPGDAAYLIISGEAEVSAETPAGPLVLATLGANEIVGEMAILGNVPRAATVRAKGRLITLRISKEPMYPVSNDLGRILASAFLYLKHEKQSDHYTNRYHLSEPDPRLQSARPVFKRNQQFKIG